MAALTFSLELFIYATIICIDAHADLLALLPADVTCCFKNGKLFSDWDGVHVVVNRPDFDFVSALKARITKQDTELPGDELFEFPFEPESPDAPDPSPSTAIPTNETPPPSEEENSEDDSDDGWSEFTTPVGSDFEPATPNESTPAPPPLGESSITSKPAMPNKSTPAAPPLDGPSVTSNLKRKAMKKAQSRNNRKKRRTSAKVGVFGNLPPRDKTRAKHTTAAQPILTTTDTASERVASTGYVGRDDRERSTRIHTLAELVGEDSEFKFQLQKWDGCTPIPIVNREGRIITLLAGHPDDPQWIKLQQSVADEFDQARRDCSSSAPGKKGKHRRGAFTTMRCGILHGGGQTHPQNLKNTKNDKKVLRKLNGLEGLRRISGFASSVFEYWAPDLHRFYVDKLTALQENDKTLQRPFERSVFPVAMYNLGRQTCCFKHIDFANLPYGWCAITALGDFDHTTGGHLVLWECGLVIEFPPGATVLIPSAVIHHSNTALAPGERRFSFTQYAAGGLFRWVDHGFKTVESHRSSLNKSQLVDLDAENANRWAFGLGLLSKIPWASPPSQIRPSK